MRPLLQTTGVELGLECQKIEERQPAVAVEVGSRIGLVEQVLEREEVELREHAVLIEVGAARTKLGRGLPDIELAALGESD